MNWSIIGFIVLIWLIIIAFGMMLYFEYVDPLLRQARWRREQENSSYTLASDGYPAVTWLLEAQFRELSDEEIDYEFDEFVWTGSRRADFELIVRQIEKTILRKAQEK